MKYRKKPIVVEAEQYSGRPGGLHAFDPDCPMRAVRYDYHPLTGHSGKHRQPECGSLTSYIETANGPVIIGEGIWVVRDPATGDAWPVSPDIFAATYEPA